MKSTTLVTLLMVLLLTGTLRPAQAQAQAPPGTDILLVGLQGDAITIPAGIPFRLTDRDGYDNQPFFTEDGSGILYTSGRGEQTDIYHVDIATGTSTQRTKTAESEYSATLLPTGDGFSVIRVEADGTQRLWAFDAEGMNPTLVLEDVQPVGYQAWADAHTLALFVLGDPPTLQVADTRTGKAEIIASNIGRSIHRVPLTNTISFVHKAEDEGWWIKALDPATGTLTPVVKTLPGREDYAWRPDGSIFMADGPILYAWHPDNDTWAPFHDFSDHGVTTITRLAVSPAGTHLALVVDRP